ncbi:MAG TPA: HAD family hydrolase [Candidatus Saccharimonadia bacterium]|nr:HAD family hydrolase [Candidatus Saccharimonadia bacterium]
MSKELPGSARETVSGRNYEHELWRGSHLAAKLRRQRELGAEPPRVLIADRDGTHSMDGQVFQGSAEALAVHTADTAKLNDYLADRGIILIMNTGGSVEMMEAGLVDGTIPADAVLVLGGSEFWVAKDGRYERDVAYQDYIENVIGYRREALYPLCQDFLRDMTASGGARRVDMWFQPADSETNIQAWQVYRKDPQGTQLPAEMEPPAHKISFDIEGPEADAEYARFELAKRLDARGLERLTVVHTADNYQTDRYSLHLLPLGKREAADIVIELLERQCGPVLAAVAGDAQNDTEMVLNSGSVGIAVGNRQEALERAIEELPSTRETKHFKIVGDRIIYRDDTERTAAASLLQAVRALETADILLRS